jgi:hypothetical protein
VINRAEPAPADRPGLTLRLGLLFVRLGLLSWVVAVSVGASRPLMGVIEVTASRTTALISSTHSGGHDENDKYDGHGNHDDDDRRVAHCVRSSGHISDGKMPTFSRPDTCRVDYEHPAATWRWIGEPSRVDVAGRQRTSRARAVPTIDAPLGVRRRGIEQMTPAFV